MYGTPRAYKKATNDQDGERRGTPAAATVFVVSSVILSFIQKTVGFLILGFLPPLIRAKQ